MIDAGRQVESSKYGSQQGPLTTTRTSTIIRVLNDTGSNLDRGRILGLEEPIFVPEETSEAAALREVAFVGVEPATKHTGKFAVLLEPALTGVVVRAVIAGACWARVNVVDETHTYADVEDGETGALKSSFDGSAQILWKESDIPYGYYDTGEQWAIVRLGTGGLATGVAKVSTEISKATSNTRPGKGAIKLYTTLDMTTSPPTYGGLTTDTYECLSINRDKKIAVDSVVNVAKVLGVWHAVNVDKCDNLLS